MSAVVDPPDPRPQLAPGTVAVAGHRCVQCRYPIALDAPLCPQCRGPLEPAVFSSEGTVWSATVLRVPLPGRTPPTSLIYVDIDDGPRVLGHVHSADHRLRCGVRVRISGATADGDLSFEPIEET